VDTLVRLLRPRTVALLARIPRFTPTFASTAPLHHSYIISVDPLVPTDSLERAVPLCVAGLPSYMAKSDYLGFPGIIGYGSSPPRCGPARSAVPVNPRPQGSDAIL